MVGLLNVLPLKNVVGRSQLVNGVLWPWFVSISFIKFAINTVILFLFYEYKEPFLRS